MIEIKRNTITVDIFSYLETSVGWGIPLREQISKALENSLCTFEAYDDKKIIGMARLIGDYGMSFLVKDVVVLPNYQGKGVGSLLVQEIKNYIQEQTPKGWKICLEVMSAKNKEGFYGKFGFEKRPSEHDGSGMMMMVQC